MIYITHTNSDIYKVDVVTSEVGVLPYDNFQLQLITEEGTYKDFLGTLHTVVPGDFIVSKRGLSSLIKDIAVLKEVLDNNSNSKSGCIEDCCDAPSLN